MTDYSRSRECTNSLGGNSVLYIFPFVNYSRSQISVVDNVLTLFPDSYIYDTNPSNISFKEDVDEEGGGVSFTQSGGFRMPKILRTDDFKSLVSQDFRAIVRDNNGNYRLIGLYTGLKIKYIKDTGVNKPDFNGFDFTYETREENTAPFLDNLNFFSFKDALQELLQYEL
tara:strand:- start:12187 stop:12696 length:510 start_codon:yes stop_codon:yes gene_type:complete